MTRRRTQGGKCLDVQWRRQRARKAGLESQARNRRLLLERGETFPTKGHAYAAGYRTGYIAAMHWWHRRARREHRVSA